MASVFFGLVLALLLGFVSPVAAQWPWADPATVLPVWSVWLGFLVPISCFLEVPVRLGWGFGWLQVFWSAGRRLEVAQKRWESKHGLRLVLETKLLSVIEEASAFGLYPDNWDEQELRRRWLALAQEFAGRPQGSVSRMDLFPWIRAMKGYCQEAWTWIRSKTRGTGDQSLESPWLERLFGFLGVRRAQSPRRPTVSRDPPLPLPAIAQTDGPGDIAPPRAQDGEGGGRKKKNKKKTR